MMRLATIVPVILLTLVSGLLGLVEHDHELNRFDRPDRRACVIDHGQASVPPESDLAGLWAGGTQHDHECVACQSSRTRIACSSLTVSRSVLLAADLVPAPEIFAADTRTASAHAPRGPPQS